MKDITGREIKQGDWVYYGVKQSTSISYSFAYVTQITTKKRYGRDIHVLHVIVGKQYGRTWTTNLKRSKVENDVLIVPRDIVPFNVEVVESVGKELRNAV